MKKSSVMLALSGAIAGIVNGLFGAGGGLVLAPLLTKFAALKDEQIFPSSVAIIFPICVITLLAQYGFSLPFQESWPYLLGSIPGGILAGIYGKYIPAKWLHRSLGILLLYGGVKYLC